MSLWAAKSEETPGPVTGKPLVDATKAAFPAIVDPATGDIALPTSSPGLRLPLRAGLSCAVTGSKEAVTATSKSCEQFADDDARGQSKPIDAFV